ncbi:hypothetical protein BDR07DRAFT_1583653 [Suillus spraguei]|nr:hypothetical protein BDR07DRAFT_1583653 [Suillus spraguei]
MISNGSSNIIQWASRLVAALRAVFSWLPSRVAISRSDRRLYQSARGRKRTSRPCDNQSETSQYGATSAGGSRLCEVRCADGACVVPLVLGGAHFLRANASRTLEGTGKCKSSGS